MRVASEPSVVQQVFGRSARPEQGLTATFLQASRERRLVTSRSYGLRFQEREVTTLLA